MRSIGSSASTLCAASLALLVCGAPAWGATAPDIARKYCQNCHKIAFHEKTRNEDAGAPSFFRIANDPVMGTDANLTHMISQTHASMPPFELTATERHDLINYIESFKAKPD